jgi:hypothetical protein
MADVVGLVFADFRRDADIGAEEGGAQLRDKFLAGIACIAEFLPAEVAVEARLVAGPVRELTGIGRTSR